MTILFQYEIKYLTIGENNFGNKSFNRKFKKDIKR